MSLIDSLHVPALPPALRGGSVETRPLTTGCAPPASRRVTLHPWLHSVAPPGRRASLPASSATRPTWRCPPGWPVHRSATGGGHDDRASNTPARPAGSPPPIANRQSTIEIRNILLDVPDGMVYVRSTSGGGAPAPPRERPGRKGGTFAPCSEPRQVWSAPPWSPGCLEAWLPGGLVAFSKKKNANRTQFSALALSKTPFVLRKRTQSNPTRAA
jgi:hypothetical protein